MGKLNTWLKFSKIALVIIALLSIVLFVINTDYNTLINEINRVGFKFTYILFLTFTAYLLGTLGWQVCMGDKKKNISLFQLFIIRQIGETLALFNPTSVVAGDLLKAKLLNAYQIDSETALKSVTVSRITATLSQLMLFIIAMLWLLLSQRQDIFSIEVKSLIVGSIGILLLIKLALLIWLAKPLKEKPTVQKNSTWNRLKSSIIATLYNTKICFQQEKKLFWYSYLFFVLHWIVGSLEFYFLLSFMGISIQPMHGLVLDMSVIIIKSMGAAIPGQIGIEELANKITLTIIGIQGATVWISISILRRLRQLTWIAVGILMTIFHKKEIKHATAL
ncbi:conserved hypothetical protein [Sphingobacterium nematocida]|uniref:Lysylphosphatidylglycerol synthase TM region n=1 Tax=Sphingobacterium nematocida TaxID=1513896 RepID=A0A1T5C8D6_9SPHI|nr:lysylphosphatidylglycerol synthase domain-containing protein [Sphingobacterium nematocida]SKB55694.1 conserved hypothetical protein [Sphingobacterium nematocida]